MAVFARYDELKREIDALICENEELKQLVQLLRENQELKCILHQQYNENALLPAPESPAADIFAPTSALPDYAQGSSAAGSSMVPRGYCFDCPTPCHPHHPPSPHSGYGFGSGNVDWSTVATTSSAFPPRSRSPLGCPQLLDSGFASLLPQADTSLAGFPFPSPLPMFPANHEPNPQHALVPVYSPGSPLSYSPRPFPPLVLQNQNAGPCVQQPPFLGGRFRGPPPSGFRGPPPTYPWFGRPCRPAQPPCPEPLPAAFCPPAPPLEQTKPSDEKPEQDPCPEKTETPSKGSKQESLERVVGEIAFQLDRRILSSVFPDRVRLYGFTVRNIPEKVMQRDKDPYFTLTEEQAATTMKRYEDIMRHLQPLGYDPEIHPRLTELIVNTFGILRERPELKGPEAASYNNLQFLQKAVRTVVPPNLLSSCMLLLCCLHQLSVEDGKPLFIW